MNSRRSPITAAAVAAFLFIVPAASASVLNSGSGWNWGSPTPQGNTLNAVEFISGVGYAVGENGTVIKTTDSGVSWSGLSTNLPVTFNNVQLLGTDNIIVGGECTLLRSTDGGGSFTRLPWTASDASCSEELSSFSFVNDSTGYILLGDGSVFQTLDAGLSWSAKGKVPTGSDTTSINFLSADVGVASAEGNIYRTTDQGTTWTTVYAGSPTLRGISFLDANTGYATGDVHTLLKTTDGGATWAAQATDGVSAALNFNRARCADKDTCLITVTDGSAIVRTTDGGASWSTVNPASQKVFAAGFSSSTQAVAVGSLGATARSTDGGANWSQVGTTATGTIYQVKAVSNSVAVAPISGGVGTFARTVDGGVSWSILTASTTNEIVDVSFADADNGFVLDDQGGLFSTTNGGQGWVSLSGGVDGVPDQVHAFSSSRLLLVGSVGAQLSTDGGQSFDSISTKIVRKSKLDTFRASGNIGVAFKYRSKGALVLTTDAGKSWREVPRPNKRVGTTAAQFVTKKLGYLIDNRGMLWKTTNAGKTWARQFAVGTHRIYGLWFESATKGYVVTRLFGDVSAGYLLRTSDGGKTWRPQLVSPRYLGSGLSSAGGTTYLSDYPDETGGGSSLFFSTTGGESGAPIGLKLKLKKKRMTKKAFARIGKKLKVTGTLTGAKGGETVVVSYSTTPTGNFTEKEVVVGTNGKFSISLKLKGTAYLVARYAGDSDHRGAGTKLATFTVSK